MSANDTRTASNQIRIYMGDNHSSWDENGWVWFMGFKGDQYCALRITPHKLIDLRKQAEDFRNLIELLEAEAQRVSPDPHPEFNLVYSLSAQPSNDPAELLPDWLSSLYFVGPEGDNSTGSQWRGSGTARAMIAKALSWPPADFKGAYLMANAGMIYSPEKIREAAKLLNIDSIAAR